MCDTKISPTVAHYDNYCLFCDAFSEHPDVMLVSMTNKQKENVFCQLHFNIKYQLILVVLQHTINLHILHLYDKNNHQYIQDFSICVIHYFQNYIYPCLQLIYLLVKIRKMYLA